MNLFLALIVSATEITEIFSFSFFSDGFFSKEPGTCFCDKCYQVGAVEETYKMKGDPPTEYSLPTGWAKFPLKKHPSATEKIDTWQVAFYGTRPGDRRESILFFG